MAEGKFEQAVIQKLESEGWDYLPAYSGVTVCSYTKKMDYFYSVRKMKV